MAKIIPINNLQDLYMFEKEYGARRDKKDQENDSEGRKPKKKYKNKDNQKDEGWNFKFHPPHTLAHIELEPNASKFLVYSAIRSAVLEGEARSQSVDRECSSKKAAICCFVCNGICKPNNQIECACHLSNKSNRDECNSDAGGGANTGIESDSDDNSEKDMMTIEVPKIVGAGLKSLFELISDARNIQPSLCTKALKALFDVVQGQYPESFRNEPNDLIDPLYDLLLDLATVSPGKGAWSSIACSTLIGLCIARGDTGKILKAIAALLMSPKHISGELIPLPNVLSSLQRTVICAALNKPSTPTFFSHGVPKTALIDSFSLKTLLQELPQNNLDTCLASDGSFLYLFTQGVLYKVGTGFNGTFKGHIYTLNQELSKEKFEWIGFINNRLYLKRTPKRATSSDKFLLLNPENLTITGSTEIYLPTSSKGITIKENSVIFCDDEGISAICTNKNEALVIKQIFTTIQSPSTSCYELPLKLARQKFRTLGYATFEDEILNQAQIQKIQTSFNKFEPKLPEIHDVDVLSIACGKEFGLVCTSNGKIYYYGKSASLGLKSIGRTPNMRLTELMISKPSNITQFAIGHDGLHALILNDDGTVYFTGTARRGEDGDNSKNRRQPKPVKPKKLSKIDGHVIVNAAANNGTSAFVTKAGKLIIFGKDTSHCDSMGFVSDLFDQEIVKVALGKAHCIALNSKGHLFSFGMNNKGQCGRMSASRTSREDPMTDSVDMDGKRKFDFSAVCESDEHSFSQGQCRVCSICKECTGFNTSCVSSLATPVEGRVAGSVCQCGHGDAGCSKCGICNVCASLQEGEINPIDEPLKLAPGLSRHRNKAVIRKKEKKSGDDVPILENDRDPPRVASLPPQKVPLPSTNPVIQISCGLHHTVVLTSVGEVFTFGSNQYGQLGTCDLQPVIGPTQVKVPGIVTQIAAGSNHTILLTNKGIVYTFGNYQKGQLGRLPTDIQKHIGDEAVKASSPVRDGSMSPIMSQRQKFLWHCSPGSVFGLGPNFGKRVTWIGASGDQTFIKVDESLVTPQMLAKMYVVANKRTILMIPTIPLSFNLLTINRQDGSCTAHVRQQVDFVKMISDSQNLYEMNSNLKRESRNFDMEESKRPQVGFCIDPTFNVFWVYDGTEKQMLCYNVLASEIKEKHPDSPNFRAVLSPELCLSSTKSCVSRSQASLNLLSCLDILSSAQDSIPYCFEQTESQDLSAKMEAASSADCQVVNRFENFGGGWGYSGHSIECIRFSTDTDVLICGFALFGGRGEYTCKIKLYDLGLDGGSSEKDGIIIAETREIPYECPSRGKYNVMLQKPVNVFASRWYLISARVSGPSSDCGSSGQSNVTTEDQVVFTFKSSKKSNNGTDVCSGQIPAILYRLVTEENKQLTNLFEIDPVQKISKSFGNTVTKECFDSLVILLKWAWESFKTILKDQKDKSKSIQIKTSLRQLSYVNKSCLRLLKKYTNEIYPKRNNKFKSKKLSSDINSQTYNITKSQTITSKLFLGAPELSASIRKPNTENIQLAESIGNVRALLISILCDDVFKNNLTLEASNHANDILDECHQSFVACFHAFYPTSSLKWNCLCDLLYQMDNGVLYCRLLSGILAGLCNPIVKLRVTFSLLNPGQERQSIVSPSDNSGLPMLSSSESHQYPILVEQMIYRSQQEKVEFPNYSWTFKDVLTRLLDIVALPIRSKIENIYHRTINFNELEEGGEINQGLIKNCCNLISRVLSEIIYHPQCGDYESTLLNSSRSLHCSGNRFARCDVSKTWNTGNFGPDAIAFIVDRPGIAVAGAMVYSGSGSYDYQLELLYDNSSEGQVPHKWESLEAASGSYDQSAVCNDMAEIKFERPIHIKENVRYALRLCSQGARTCSGDSGLNSIRGPDGSNFTFYPCDLSFNGTTPIRGQIPCILYYSTPMKKEGRIANYVSNETAARDAALQIVSDITKKCTELLVLARNAMAVNSSSGDKSPNSSNNTHTVDSEHNITPIEEHIDVSWAHPSRAPEPSISAARDLTKRFESFSKNIMDSLKRSTNPFDSDVEIGDEIDREQQEANRQPKNGNDRKDDDNQKKAIVKSESVESSSISFNQMLELFNINSSNMFQNLLPIAYAHIGALASTDPKSSVQILCLVKEILPHVAALNQLFSNRDNMLESQMSELDQREDHQNNENNLNVGPSDMDLCTTSNHYCIVESDHPYKSGSVSTYRVVFPSCVQWFTIEFDPQSGTSQCEDYLLISIPSRPMDLESFKDSDDVFFGSHYKAKGANVMVNCYSKYHGSNQIYKDLDEKASDFNWTVVHKFNSSSSWSQNVLVLPGNKVEFSLETASFYLQDMKANRFGFKCMIVGYDNPAEIPQNNNNLIRLEYELANLGGMCSANLMKKELRLAEENCLDDSSALGETLSSHYSLLSKGLALSDSMLTIHQALDTKLPIGSQSNERQFLKDFISGAPGSSGARLAAWLQPEPRLDPNKCELNAIVEPVRYGWPTQLTVTVRDQYGDAVIVPELKVEIKVIPSGGSLNGGKKGRNTPEELSNSLYGGVPNPPRISYEPTIKDKMCFKAITFMKPYTQYSFEELRYCNPTQFKATESLFATDNENGTFSVNWTPNAVGNYCLNIYIDDIPLEDVHRVEVREGGIPPPIQTLQKRQMLNKVRKFFTKNSAGLRIRSHPTLQSEEVGILKVNGIISFIDEIENDDGVWVRLSTESIRQHCNTGWYPTEAWCLQFNQHLGKTLLHPIEETILQTTDEKKPAENEVEKVTQQMQEVSIIDEDPPSIGEDALPAMTNPFTPKDENKQQNNLGNAIAGVVGGSASKLQAIHKWFKKEEANNLSKRRGESFDTNPSVREIVRSLGQDFGKSNGNSKNSSDSEKQDSLGDLHHSPLRVRSNSVATVVKMSPKHSPRRSRFSSKMPLKEKNCQNIPIPPKAFYGPPKRALPPSVAESLRAVFAAFLWHEGLVHDAMACASFLKFHPSLQKQGVANNEPHEKVKPQAAKEFKAKQRHSVEVANTGNYLNIRPSTLETLNKSGNTCVNNRKLRRANDEMQENINMVALSEVTICELPPPSLRCLVYLWEELSNMCIQVVQTNSFVTKQQKMSPNENPNVSFAKNENIDRENKKLKRRKKDDASWCELCEIFMPIPVTYHMRLVHPGCGKPARGKGYNSVGMYCEGWAGNCGEGGKGASSWFLMCDACREKYILLNKNVNVVNETNDQNTLTNSDINIFGGKTGALLANSEIYTTMKDNAIFLLELNSSDNMNIMKPQRRSPQMTMPIVTEDPIPGPSYRMNSRPRISRRSQEGSWRKSSSPDLMWVAPKQFSCLETLGTTISKAFPNALFEAAKDNFFEGQLSEMSYYDSVNAAASDQLTTPVSSSQIGPLSKVHRSMSMGQGWGNVNAPPTTPKPVGDPEEPTFTPRVVMRRKNNISNDEGTLLICYPSENLRKLVPENLVNSAAPPQPHQRPVTIATDENPIMTEQLVLQKDSNNGLTLQKVKTPDKQKQAVDYEENLNKLLSRPVINFITKQHDLVKMRSAMKRSIRITICRIYALQAYNWLLRSVTQSVCLHDIMWWFVSSLNPSNSEDLDGEEALEHPGHTSQFSGSISQILSQSLHLFLQSVADITLLLPSGSSLQRVAIECFGIKFNQADHQFLHKSHVFGNISKILSKSDEQNEQMILSTLAADGISTAPGARFTPYLDLTGMFEITVSSRPALSDSLIDNSTETFWESDEEDRNKCKIIEISMTKINYACKKILVHIDNTRDIQQKVSNIVFFGGQSLGDTHLLRSIEIDQKSCTWVSTRIPDETFTHFRLELRGPENTLRVRQIKLVGVSYPSTEDMERKDPKLVNATYIQQKICENETLRVFRLLSGQVFGKLIATNCENSLTNSLLADSLDLREHMVGILFSRSKLSHLQKQVIVYIVHAIKKEAQRSKEDWELFNATTDFKELSAVMSEVKSDTNSEKFKSPDTYCFEMLSMVLALSGSTVGRSYLSHQHGLLKDLLTLLHTGSDRIQRQVTALLRRILPEISPEIFADLLGIQKLPPTNYLIEHSTPNDFDMNRLGILDIFLAVIAKSLQLQLKIKTTTKSQAEKSPCFIKLCGNIDFSVHLLKQVKKTPPVIIDEEGEEELDDEFVFPAQGEESCKKGKDSTKNLNQRWFLKGIISIKQAENIISFIRDMASGKMSERWSGVTKAAIAEAVLNLTRLDVVFRSPDICVKTSTLWLALASLCVLDMDHVEKLSSGQWTKVSECRPMCSNHDDGETSAIIQCEQCGSLCGDCDRFLHLNRKTRNHRRTVCKEEEEAIRVELHETCGRTKLFWLLALADSKTLKGIVEFRDGNHTLISGPLITVGCCRFCGVTGNSGLLEIGNVCADTQCQEYAANSCMKIKPCGHSCGGVANEKKCLPCLQHVNLENKLAEATNDPKLTQDADDMCMICFVEALSCAPAIQLECGHVFHYHCCGTVLEKKWSGPRITFGFSLCPICKSDIQHDMLSEILEPINSLRNDVKRKALMRIKYEGVIKSTDEKYLTTMAMDRYAYYVCFKCKKSYFGGEARCNAEVGEKFDPEELVCGGCSDVAKAQMCPKHGTDFLEYKCRYCCSVAVFFCFGTTHFCDTCHDDFQRLSNIAKNKLPQCPVGPKGKPLPGDECPLHIVHPPTGEEFALGCGVCRNAQTF